MKAIELILEPITGYLSCIKRNTVDGRYEMEIGIPKGWVFNENKDVKCDILSENDSGKLIKISSKNNNIVIDDLVTFVEIIIETNGKIAEKEKQFTDKMEEMKGMLEKEAKRFYEELDELKENSFNSLNDNFNKKIYQADDKEVKKEIKETKKTKNKNLANVVIKDNEQ